MSSLFPKVGQNRPGMRLSKGALMTFLWAGIALHLFPFYYLLVISFTPDEQAKQATPQLWPQTWDFSAWKNIWNLATDNVPAQFRFIDEPFYVYFGNSLFIAGMTLLLSLPITAFAAYACSKLLKGRTGRAAFLFFIGTMMVPFVVVLVPTFLLTRFFPFITTKEPDIPTLELFNTPWAVILVGVFAPFAFLLFKGFFDTIPDSVIQAARVDGGSEFNIFRRIVLPMSIPVFAVVAYTNFASVWDNFLWQLLVLQSSDQQTTSVAIYNVINAFMQQGADNPLQAGSIAQKQEQLAAGGLTWGSLMTLGLLQTLPIFVTFIVCREYLLKGIRIRGMK